MADNTTLSLERDAIQKAMESRWEEAIDINKKILEANPNDTSALNRLGIAYLKTNQHEKAKKTFHKVVEHDPFNAIAKTNLKKATPRYSSSQATPLSGNNVSFIEESGKSKVLPLNNLGEPNVLGALYTGLEVSYKVSSRKIKVIDSQGRHIGFLPDDVSTHLNKLIQTGNKYSIIIKIVDPNNVQVFMKETFSSKKAKGIPSFTMNTTLDHLEISSGHTNQPPLEIYDQTTEDQG